MLETIFYTENIERNEVSRWLPIIHQILVGTLNNHIHNEIKNLGFEKNLDKLFEQ